MTDRVFASSVRPRGTSRREVQDHAGIDHGTSRVLTESGGRSTGGRSVMIGAVLFLGLTIAFAGFGRPGAQDAWPAAATSSSEMLGADRETANFAPDQSLPPEGEAGETSLAGSADFNGDGVPVVCLDPGHGGDDTGFTRPGAGSLPALDEASLNLATAIEVARRLENQGIVVVMTRRDAAAVNAEEADVNGDGQTFESAREQGASVADANRIRDFDELQARINVCNRANADLLVSMHINGYYERTTVRGFETWFTGCRAFGDRSERFAQLAYVALEEQFGAANFETEERGLKNDCEIDVDPSDPALGHNMIITGPEVPGKVKPSEMPGAIIESLFLSNDNDAAFLASEAGREAIVSAYERSILAYFRGTDAADE
jgi:N-acetylmuramoyl-L-alanine amidase